MSTRDQLVSAAAELLWERGYGATSPAAIQQRAGAGQGSMYHHFSGKAELAKEAIEGQAQELRSTFQQAVDGPEHAADRLLAYLELERAPLRGCRLGRQAQDAEVLADDILHALLAQYFAWLLDQLATLVRDGQRGGELDPGIDPRGLAGLIVAAVQGAYVLARATGDAEHYRRCIDSAAEMVRALRVTG